jgi:heme/copper-type cytochrome/quinol oxidase subunit 3
MTEVEFRDELRPFGVEERPLAYWGMLLTMAVLATTYAALYFTYVYIRVATVDWPPAGIDPPGLDLAGASAAALALSVVPMWWASRREVAGGMTGLRLGLVLALVLAGAHLGLVAADWARADFTVSTHAYGSLFFVLPGFHASIFAIALVMGVVLLLMSLKGHVGPERHIGMRSLAIFWFTLVGGGLGVLAVVYLLPHVWPTAQVGS